VDKAIHQWIQNKKKIYIYSSGSIEAQKLLFGFSEKGDLTPSFSGYFDTTTGPKVEASSYSKIASSLEVPATRILFLTDVLAEARAARGAGFQTAVSLRHENAPLSAGDLVEIANFPTFRTMLEFADSDVSPNNE